MLEKRKNNSVNICFSGNVGIGTTSPNYKLTVNGEVMLMDGSAPVASAGYAGIYANGGELWAFDAAGNSTQLSPHDTKTGECIFYSKNLKTGKILRVDMEKLVKFIDEKFGTDFVKEFTGEVKGFTYRYNCHYLVYYERFDYINDAIAREKEIKGWIRKKKEKLIESLNPEWKFLNDEVFEEQLSF